jgi:hypothetical protein
MEQQSNRAMEQQSNGATEQQSNRATEQRSHRARETSEDLHVLIWVLFGAYSAYISTKV